MQNNRYIQLVVAFVNDFIVLQVVDLLRAVLTSNTVLTDEFISRLEEPHATASVKLEPIS
jgi:hypothetical protein